MQKKTFISCAPKTYVIFGAIALWVIFFLYAITKNPSSDDANKKLMTMRSSLDALVNNGGVVLYRNENAKLGGALLSVLISSDSWTRQLRDKNVQTLVTLGWKSADANNNAFCKERILANIQENAGNYRGKGTVYISMAYNANTIKACR